MTAPIPEPRKPLLIEQVDVNATFLAMLGYLTELGQGLDFAALPAVVRCELMLSVSDLAAVLAPAAIMHPAVKP